MTVAKPEDPGAMARLVQLVDALADSNWRMRQVAVGRLTETNAPELLPKLIEIVRTSHRDLSQLNAVIQVLIRSDSDVVQAILPLMNEADPEVRAYAALILGERGDPRAIPALVAALDDPNTNVRVHSIEAIGKLHAAEAVDRLVSFVESLDFELAFPAIEALAAIGDERIAYRLTPLLQNPLFCVAAIEALGALGNEEAVLPLIELLEDASIPTEAVCRSIQRIHFRYLQRYGSRNAIAVILRNGASPAILARLRTAISKPPAAGDAAVLAIISWLPGEEAEATLLDKLARDDLRKCSIEALARRGSAVIPAILHRLHQRAPECLSGLIEICGRIGDRRTIPALLECLGENDERIIVATLEAMSRIGGEPVYAPAKALLGHPSAAIRQAAVAVLNSHGHPSTARDMRALLQDSGPLVLESAVRVAAYFGFPECIDLLLACCDDPNARVCKVAIEHLPVLDDPRVLGRLESALRSENPQLRAAAAGALGEIESDAAIQLLRTCLEDRDVWVRYYGVRSLARIGIDDETETTIASLAAHDSAMQVRIAAVEALGGHSVPLITTLADSPEEDFARTAIAVLGASRRAEALPPLLAAARSGNSARQIEAIRGLAKSGLPGAVPPLLEFALGRDQTLADEALAALGSIPTTESINGLLVALEAPAKRSRAIASLIGMGAAAIPTLAHRLRGLPLDSRRAVIDVLIGIHTSAAIGVLETASDDPAPAVRNAALSALAHVEPFGEQRISDGYPEGNR